MNKDELKMAKEIYHKFKMDAESIKVNSIALEICEDIKKFLRVFEDYEKECPVPYDGFLRGIKYRLEGNEIKEFVGQMEGVTILDEK